MIDEKEVAGIIQAGDSEADRASKRGRMREAAIIASLTQTIRGLLTAYVAAVRPAPPTPVMPFPPATDANGSAPATGEGG